MTAGRETTLAAVGLGGNVGDVRAAFARALGRLDAHADVRVGEVSSLWRSAPWGLVEQDDFLNAVALLSTSLEPAELLGLLQEQEQDAGRATVVRWGPRELDLDLLWHGDVIVNDPDLQIPHPRLLDRSFVLEPALEVCPAWRHPVTGESLAEARDRLRASAEWTRCTRWTEAQPTWS